MVILVLVFYVLLGLFICNVLLKWNEYRFNKKGLPPGTLGWPVFGETTEFLKKGPNFMKNQRDKYGSIFKSHILGCPTIVSMDTELNRYILLNEGKGLVPGYPQSLLDVLGKGNIAAVHDAAHKSIRGALLTLINPTTIKDQLLPKIDDFVRSHLSNWDGKIIDIQEKTREMALLSSFKQIATVEYRSISEAFKPEFYKLVLGSLSLPINLPGTNYRRGFQARKNVVRILGEIIKERRASLPMAQNDMLGCLLRMEDPRYIFSDEEIIDQIIMIMYSAYETVSTTSMMVIKYLHDHPRALKELMNEHLAIRKGKEPKDMINWNDYKSMKFTRAVIFETMRLATIVNGVLRKTTREMKLNGFVIPKGWKIYVYTRESNYDPSLYPEPLTFNPWRWQDKSLESHNHFMLFGGGSRLCPGKELGLAEISTFLHYFVTKYRYDAIHIWL
ncbi:Cytochrome P450 [Macleaya cordata]|uniref:Cytochrome P450 n=1 Tax=Macleaya cordata TaxID=56857 RepID=A0A200QVV8_MACCD|nr:Cytochrome P450 [Macleaya cordata]